MTSNDANALLHRKLCYAKWLYHKGTEQAEGDDELSHLVAITHFFNAIEITAVSIVLHCQWTNGGSVPHQFHKILDLIEKKGGNDKVPPQVPHRAEVDNLKNTRNSIMHRGAQFHTSEVEAARKTCRLFMKDCCQDFLDIDIDEISMATLIQDDWLRTTISSAEEKLSRGEVNEAMEDIVWAFRPIEERLVAFFSQRHLEGLKPLSHSLQYKSPAERIETTPNLHEIRENSSKTADYLEAITREMDDIRVRANQGVLLSILDTSSAASYYQAAQHIRRFFDPRTGEFEYTAEIDLERPDVEAALSFVIGAALRAESFGAKKFNTEVYKRKQ